MKIKKEHVRTDLRETKGQKKTGTLPTKPESKSQLLQLISMINGIPALPAWSSPSLEVQEEMSRCPHVKQWVLKNVDQLTSTSK